MKSHSANRIEGIIDAKEIILGKGVVVEKGAVIRGKFGAADKVRLGDYCFIGRGTTIMTPHFELGDYSKLNAESFVHGVNPARIGRNCWFGGNVILDSQGGLDIDDNVGIGAHSQVWTHMQFGDLVEGCRFFSKKYMYLGKDTWLVGHCILSPVEVGEKSMALVGSVITRDMLPNHVYAGVPARDVTEKMGTQFEDRTAEKKLETLDFIISDFLKQHPAYSGSLKGCLAYPEKLEPGVTYFNVTDRTYSQTHNEPEVIFLKSKVPLIKFVPRDSLPWLTRKKGSIS